jgi:hypothetical protein
MAAVHPEPWLRAMITTTNRQTDRQAQFVNREKKQMKVKQEEGIMADL